MSTTTRSTELYHRALELLPGGVNSPVRAMRAVGLDEPFFAERGDGAYLFDVEGNRYLDWVLSWGPLIFGHADSETVEAVRDAAQRGTTFGASTEAEVGGPNFFTCTVTETAGVSASTRSMSRSASVSSSLYETRVPSSTTREASLS